MIAAALLLACSRHTSTTTTSPPTSGGATATTAPADGSGRCLAAELSSKYTAVFVGSASRVQEIFLGWRPPGAPRTKVQRNPFTGVDIGVRTTEPPDGPADATAKEWNLRPGEVPQDAGYEGYLESRIPPEVRPLPHRATKRIWFEMMAVAAALSGQEAIPEVLYPPNGCTTALPLLRMPDTVTTALREMKEAETAELEGRLARSEAFDGWSPPDVAAFLADLRTLLRSGASQDGLYLLFV